MAYSSTLGVGNSSYSSLSEVNPTQRAYIVITLQPLKDTFLMKDVITAGCCCGTDCIARTIGLQTNAAAVILGSFSPGGKYFRQTPFGILLLLGVNDASFVVIVAIIVNCTIAIHVLRGSNACSAEIALVRYGLGPSPRWVTLRATASMSPRWVTLRATASMSLDGTTGSARRRWC
eukprot:scaffold6178_cov72-Cylindrotheca_fusiformis.AAC.1